MLIAIRTLSNLSILRTTCQLDEFLPNQLANHTTVKLRESYMKANLFDETKVIGLFDPSDKVVLKQLNLEAKGQNFVVIEGDTAKNYPLCSSFGSYWLPERFATPDIPNMGLGLTNYFKLIKLIFFVFFLVGLISVPALITYISNNNEKPVNTIYDALFKSTIGNISSSYKLNRIIQLRFIKQNSFFRKSLSRAEP